MNLKGILRYGSVGCAGYLLGLYIERNSLISNDGMKKYPGLPLYGSVSAATPINPDSKSLPVSVEEKSSSLKSRVGEIMKYGFPSLDNVRSLDDYVLAYDRRNRVAAWVFEHLTAESVKKNDQVDRSKCEFTEDKSIHEYFRSRNSDYKGSGFDRGHLAAAGNHRVCQRHVEQTFLLSNMAPQVGVGFNRDSWNKLEQHVRRLTRIYPNVYVCTGPLYLPKTESDGKLYIRYQVIGTSHVAVPTHFFKIVVMELHDKKLHMEAYVMPNQKIADNTPLNVFMVPPESIERASGLLFFDRMSRSNLVQINGMKTTYV
ncbi:endonuclease G, mitochondrial-like isoform X1 [Macrosteles quadrilineatus]|uniref:endonuclease G, mitochondrial-like isoform X1 n=1 Tax=Macrosteles quadrilineatus TaxID=74068 RepID=UPI0023E2BBD2|nr:endonuclease G, mitochondrial-like isoform X1 [Macrosteles quadrilineatus]